MTKCIVLGEVPEEKREPKRIEFVEMLKRDLSISDDRSCLSPSEWENIELISLDYDGEGTDIIFAYDADRSDGTLYFGYWNDGVV